MAPRIKKQQTHGMIAHTLKIQAQDDTGGSRAISKSPTGQQKATLRTGQKSLGDNRIKNSHAVYVKHHTQRK